MYFLISKCANLKIQKNLKICRKLENILKFVPLNIKFALAPSEIFQKHIFFENFGKHGQIILMGYAMYKIL